MITIPLRTGRGMNSRGHWRKTDKRREVEQTAVGLVLNTKPRPRVPCSVLLTRIAPSGGLDDDNLVGSLKNVRDAVAKWIGIDDRERMQVRYRYSQRRGPWGVQIEFGEPVVGAQYVLEAME